jgi:hypothetical protein
MKKVVEWVTKQQPGPPKAADAPVVLAVVTIPADPNAAVTDADVSYVARSVLLSQAELFQMILALWNRVELCCAAVNGLGAGGGTAGPGKT